MANSLKGRYEAEIKCRIDDPEQAKERLLKMGAIPRFINNREHDICFDYPDQSLLNQQQYLILRYREPFGEHILFFKEDNGSNIELSLISNYEAINNILVKLGLISFLELTKTRSMFLKDDFHIVVDTLEGYGHFIEIGTMTNNESELQDMEAKVRQMLILLGYDDNFKETRSYRKIVQEGKR